MSSELTPAKALSPALDPPAVAIARSWWKQAVAGGIYRLGMMRLVRRAAKTWELAPDRKLPLRRAAMPKLAILCYHRVGAKGIPLYSALPPEVFAAQIRYLRTHYRILSLAELCDELVHPRSMDPGVAITFDDGYVGLFHCAWPVLREYRVPATVFLAVAAVETGSAPWYDRIFAALQVLPGPSLELRLGAPVQFTLGAPAERLEVAQEIVRRLRKLSDEQRQDCCGHLERKAALPAEAFSGCMLSWEQIRAMHRDGIAFGSHSVSHRVMSRLQPAEVRQELLESRRIIEERLQCSIDAFAFPFGQPADIGLPPGISLADFGYRCACTTVEGTNGPGANPYELRRTQVCEERSLPFFAWKLNALFLNPPAASSLPRHARREERESPVEVQRA